MTGLLFAAGYWCVIAAVAFGAVLFGMFLTLCVSDWLASRRQRRRWDALAETVASALADTLTGSHTPPCLDDPLEQAFALPCAPDREWNP